MNPQELHYRQKLDYEIDAWDLNAALVAEELQVPLISLSRLPGVTGIGPYVFRNMVTNKQQAEALAEYAFTQLGAKRFAILHPNIGFGVELANDFWDAVERRGGTVQGIESYGHNQTTFATEVKKLVGRYYRDERSALLEYVR